MSNHARERGKPPPLSLDNSWDDHMMSTLPLSLLSQSTSQLRGKEERERGWAVPESLVIEEEET